MPTFTPDGRYLIVRGRLWRAANPRLDPPEKARLMKGLMEARRAVKASLTAGDVEAEKAARAAVHEAKVALGERGPVWWEDGAPDYNRHLVKNTPYSDDAPPAEDAGERRTLGIRQFLYVLPSTIAVDSPPFNSSSAP